nr:MAG TPA: hypothetical protein [Caudoviricetes sp.]
MPAFVQGLCRSAAGTEVRGYRNVRFWVGGGRLYRAYTRTRGIGEMWRNAHRTSLH